MNLGYIARRAALDRPGGFDTIFDVDGAINRSLSFEKLKELDQKTMNELGQSDLSKTRLFVAYMKNDDYDDHAVAELKKSPAVRNAIQFSIKGFDGRHNDDPAVNYWFIYRLYEIMGNFGRKYE
ncbi:accessory Sec system protein Asp2 [Lactobacillus paragasseri]|uniref:accessory Sec system protein Asp2 n=1 Tax=Lactobacillus paragasseri TaxID=2107999 RepID=UPI001FD39227|nr:accessory Sec system protein Asp2 [Lactobacillus paragasseri]